MTTIITYEDVKNMYARFKSNLPQDKFTRYYKEFSFMSSLIDFAKKQNLEKDVFEYRKIQENAAQQLRDMGYKITIKD